MFWIPASRRAERTNRTGTHSAAVNNGPEKRPRYADRPESQHASTRERFRRGPGDLDAAEGTPRRQTWFRSAGYQRVGAGVKASGAALTKQRPARPFVGLEAEATWIRELGFGIDAVNGGIAIGAPGRSESLCCGCGIVYCLPLRAVSASDWISVECGHLIVNRNVARRKD